MNRIKFILILLFLVSGFLFFKPKEIKAYVCSVDRFCADFGYYAEGGPLSGWKRYPPYPGDPGCTYHDAWIYDCEGTDSDCNGGFSYWKTEADCIAGTNTYSAGCCNKRTCVECTPGSAPSCPTGTTGTNTGDKHSSTSSCCTNPSGCTESQNCNTRDCYCAICTPPTCESVGLASTAQGYGSTDTKATCRNGTAQTPDRTTKCDLTGRLCYCYRCELNSCPTPLSNTPTTVAPEGNLILPDYRTCTNDCGRSRTGDCYEPFSPQPTEELVINGVENAYDFISLDHTGIPGTSAGNLNDPVSMTATYTDVDGAWDIEGVAVWLRRFSNTNEVPSPVYISTTAVAQTSNNASWGFMMHRESGTWVPYIPSWEATPQTWVPATLMTITIPDAIQFKIKGPDTTGMVIVRVTDIVSSGNTVTMNFTMRFSGSGINENVSQEKYRVYLLGLDKFDYIPRNNYSAYPDVNVRPYWPSRKLRYNLDTTYVEPAQNYARAWTDTMKSLTIDKVAPTLTKTLAVSGNVMRLTWTATDDKSLYSIVGNIYTDTPAYADTVLFSTATTGITFASNFTPKAIPAQGIGALNSGWAFKVNPNMNLTTHSAGIDIDLGGNRTGTLTFYLTVYDDAGNMATSFQTYDLSDWFVTDGGLAYSQNGTAFQTRTFTSTLPTWSNTLPPFTLTGESLVPSMADYSSELWAESTTLNTPTALSKSNSSKSYNIRKFKSLSIPSYYDSLLNAYEKNKGGITSLTDKDINTVGTLSSTNGDTLCGGASIKYCVLKKVGNLTIDTLSCTRNILVFVDGNITVIPNIRNHPTQERNNVGCIFIASGNVNITQGSNQSTTSVKYDQLYAYILSDGDITIQQENKTGNAIRDGLYINGGLQALGSIKVERYLRFMDRSTYPVVAIDGHSKYGVISRTFFGGNVQLQKTEVGLKPF